VAGGLAALAYATNLFVLLLAYYY